MTRSMWLVLHKVCQPVADNLPPRRPHDVPYEKNAHVKRIPSSRIRKCLRPAGRIACHPGKKANFNRSMFFLY